MLEHDDAALLSGLMLFMQMKVCYSLAFIREGEQAAKHQRIGDKSHVFDSYNNFPPLVDSTKDPLVEEELAFPTNPTGSSRVSNN